MAQAHDNMTDVDLMAAQWVLRAQGEDFRDEDIVNLTQWLEAAPGHAEAFENAMLLWGQLDGLKDFETATQPVAAPADVVNIGDWRDRQAAHINRPIWKTPGAMAGIAAALVAAILIPLFTMQSAPAQVYETAKGGRQTVALADGSTLNLNTDTRISVQLSGHARKFTLERGEVALKVVHDANRPLTLTAGDTQITDIGTEFNVRRDDTSVAVAVRQGEVQLATNGAAEKILYRGDTAVHQTGAPGVTLTHGDPDEAFAWQTRHVIYRDQPLSVVVKDLNRYFATPIVVDDQAGKLRLSAILTLDSEPLVVRRLQDFLPLQAKTTQGGIYLSLGAAQRGAGSGL